MSGPVTGAGEPVETAPGGDGGVEVVDARLARVGAADVRRALPRRGRRTVGAWCFLDHFGPSLTPLDIGPHPHTGLQTVTWLVEGEVVHRDSLGSEQPIRPGQLNLMTAGRGVAHAEEAAARWDGRMHGVQMWVAQPDETRGGDPAFEHHAELPRAELPDAAATVLVGTFAGASSPARRDTDHVGAEVLLDGATLLPLDPAYEHAFVVLDGAVALGDEVVVPGRVAYVGTGRAELPLRADERSRLLLVGGVPFAEPVLMWWNFVARDRAEVSDAWRAWSAGDERFGDVASTLPRIDVAAPPWGDR